MKVFKNHQIVVFIQINKAPKIYKKFLIYKIKKLIKFKLIKII